MYSNLLRETKIIQDSWGYGFLEALEFIIDMEDQYPYLVRVELRQFMNEGAKLFAEKETV
jgi:hypothetical protein